MCASAFEIGGQGDIGEIKIQITTATPDKSAENEAEALQDKDAQKAPGALSVSHTPEGRYICVVAQYKFYALTESLPLKDFLTFIVNREKSNCRHNLCHYRLIVRVSLQKCVTDVVQEVLKSPRQQVMRIKQNPTGVTPEDSKFLRRQSQKAKQNQKCNLKNQTPVKVNHLKNS